MNISEDKALELLYKYNTSDSLRAHGKAVQAVMTHFAQMNGEDPIFWGLVGLLHDVDYEKFPDQHCIKAVEILEENGYTADFIHAVVSHGWGNCTDVEPTKYMEKVLFTIDELAGLVTAYIYMLPSKDINDVKVKSAVKKFKTPSFAAGVNREVVRKGCDMLGLTIDQVMEQVVEGLKKSDSL